MQQHDVRFLESGKVGAMIQLPEQHVEIAGNQPVGIDSLVAAVKEHLAASGKLPDAQLGPVEEAEDTSSAGATTDDDGEAEEAEEDEETEEDEKPE